MKRPCEDRENEREKKTVALLFFSDLLRRRSTSFCVLCFLFRKPQKTSPQGPQYVVTNFNIFVCTVCSGVQ